MTTWMWKYRISKQDVTADVRALYRKAEEKYAREYGKPTVAEHRWSVPDPRNPRDGRLSVSETLRAWILGQYCNHFVAWVVSGPDSVEYRLRRYGSLRDWAHLERFARTPSPERPAETQWLTFAEHIQAGTTSYLMATVFKDAMKDLVLGSEPEDSPILRELFQVAKTLHGIAGVLAPGMVWTEVGEEAQLKAMDARSVLLRQTAHRLLSAHFREWIGLDLEVWTPKGVALIERMRAVVAEATRVELEALAEHGVDSEIVVSDSLWFELNDLVLDEQAKRDPFEDSKA